MESSFLDGLVSIIMPAYNSEMYIRETLESVFKQDYAKWELIIVDDCSTDNTRDIIREYQKKTDKIRLICLPKNQGVANARNTAIKDARGRYIAFLDSDDIWVSDKLSKQINFMKDNFYVFTYHDYVIFDTALSKECGKQIKVPVSLDYNELLKGNSTGSCLTTMIDRYYVNEIYMPNQKHEDYICWLNILKKYRIKAYGLNSMLGYYRVGKMSVSSDKLKSAYWTWLVYRKSQNIGVLQSVYYFMHYAFKGILKYKM